MNGKFRKPREVNPPPTVTETIKNREYWKNKTLTYLNQKKYFDQDVRTGVCYFCKKEGKPQRSVPTYLHHLKYEHSDPLAWTIEVCSKCHYQIDKHNQKRLDEIYGKTSNDRYYRNWKGFIP